jgi:hypothetical protein
MQLSRKDELHVAATQSNDALGNDVLGNDGSGDNSADNDGNKGDDGDEGHDNSDVQVDGNNQGHKTVELVLVAFFPWNSSFRLS